MVYAPKECPNCLQPDVLDVGALVYRGINVDGNPADWDSIPPLAVDPADDGMNDLEEIVAVYGVNNDGFLFFLMEFNEVGVSASVQIDSNTTCRFYIDIKPGGDPDQKYADYCLIYKTSLVSFSQTPIPADQAVMEYWTGSFWNHSECTELQGASTDFFVEVAVPWDSIGGLNCLNSHFSASAMEPQTDFVPDLDAQYSLGCCPGEPYVPVGGEILSSKIRFPVIPVSILAVSILSVGTLLFSKKKYPH
jgi:hypothetical protein